MKTLHITLLVCQCVVVIQTKASFMFPREWQLWKTEHGKMYTSELEELEKHLVWLSNKKYIDAHNAVSDKFGYTLELNKFADMTEAEYTSLHSRSFVYVTNITRFLNDHPQVNPYNLPESMDWRNKNAVTPVKDEGKCLSCYAFSAMGALEGAVALATGNLVDLSAQNIVDCSLPYGNHGCGGGNNVNTFMYVINNGGVNEDKDYPYGGRQGQCRSTSHPTTASMSGIVSITKGDEQQLLEAVATVGPVAAAVDATSNAFRFYSSGVLDIPQCSSERATHSVLITGYGERNGRKYWLVKNSWGVQWGDEGYILMSRDKFNQCAIATAASYPSL